MTFAEQIAVASLGVSVVTAIAAWLAVPGLQPSFDRKGRVAVTVLFAMLAGLSASFGMATFAYRPPIGESPTQPASRAVAHSDGPEPIPSSGTTTFTAPDEAPISTSDTGRQPPAQQEIPRELPPPATLLGGVDGRPTEAPGLPPGATAVLPQDRIAVFERQRMQALAFNREHQWGLAAPAWREIIQRYGGHNPRWDHVAYYNLGVALEGSEDWMAAADAFEQARSVDAGRDARNLQRLGHCYEKLGRWRESMSAYEEILQLEPANPVAKRGLYWARKHQPTQ